jgi:DNA-binding transcriptional ArsR family regulator
MADIFKALADSNRRHLLDVLYEADGLTLNELSDELSMSRQAVSKHLSIMESANLISCVQDGRHKHHFLNPVPLQEIFERWFSKFANHQATTLLQFKLELEKDNE